MAGEVEKEWNGVDKGGEDGREKENVLHLRSLCRVTWATRPLLTVQRCHL